MTRGEPIGVGQHETAPPTQPSSFPSPRSRTISRDCPTTVATSSARSTWSYISADDGFRIVEAGHQQQIVDPAGRPRRPSRIRSTRRRSPLDPTRISPANKLLGRGRHHGQRRAQVRARRQPRTGAIRTSADCASDSGPPPRNRASRRWRWPSVPDRFPGRDRPQSQTAVTGPDPVGEARSSCVMERVLRGRRRRRRWPAPSRKRGPGDELDRLQHAQRVLDLGLARGQPATRSRPIVDPGRQLITLLGDGHGAGRGWVDAAPAGGRLPPGGPPRPGLVTPDKGLAPRSAPSR